MALYGRRPLAALMIAIFVLAALPIVSAKRTFDQQTAPYDEGTTDDWGYGDSFVHEVSSDALTGTIHMRGNATADDGASYAREYAWMYGHVTLPQARSSVVLDVVLDVEASARVGGAPGYGVSTVEFDFFVSGEDCYACYATERIMLVDDGRGCEASSDCGDRAPTTLTERRTVTMLLRAWEADEIPAGDISVRLFVMGDSTSSIEDSALLRGSVNGEDVRLPPGDEAISWAEHEATVTMVEMTLREPTTEDLGFGRNDLRRNQTFEFVAPYHHASEWPSCDGCADNDGDAATGAMVAKTEFEHGPSTTTSWDYQEVYMVQEVTIPYKADSARFEATVVIDEATASIDDAGGNAWAVVDSFASIWTYDCWMCAGAQDVDLVSMGECPACEPGAPATLNDHVLQYDVTMRDPDGQPIPPGVYDLTILVRTAAAPHVETVAVRQVATSGSLAQVSATVESMRLTVDPADWESQ